MKYLALALLSTSSAFQQPTTVSRSQQTRLHGFFDDLSKGFESLGKGAFDNQDFETPRQYAQEGARASHILVASAERANEIKAEIAAGASFAECAQKYSTCKSSSRGGDLGNFPPGKMVPEFDEVVFNEDTPLKTVVGPVLTQFGHHLLYVTTRTDRW